VPIIFDGPKLAVQRSHLGCELCGSQTFGGITHHRVVELRPVDFKEMLIPISVVESPLLPTLIGHSPKGCALNLSGIVTETLQAYPNIASAGIGRVHLTRQQDN
jgi:hypothetical protein